MYWIQIRILRFNTIMDILFGIILTASVFKASQGISHSTRCYSCTEVRLVTDATPEIFNEFFKKVWSSSEEGCAELDPTFKSQHKTTCPGPNDKCGKFVVKFSVEYLGQSIRFEIITRGCYNSGWNDFQSYFEDNDRVCQRGIHLGYSAKVLPFMGQFLKNSKYFEIPLRIPDGFLHYIEKLNFLENSHISKLLKTSHNLNDLLAGWVTEVNSEIGIQMCICNRSYCNAQGDLDRSFSLPSHIRTWTSWYFLKCVLGLSNFYFY